ncbi:MAG: adenosylcobalamin-dependent ribonucleoside-diphosphate reductase [Rhodospirillales bacterium]|jgi:ribonucleoside-diphosphate reductase alpha chain|nr:adenosylcobalamin-dependent ribonucleoside-diphosphate reductase [Rhodospirillales bacterium]
MAQVAPISRQIWDMKYRLKHADGHPVDKTIDDTWRRVARALSETEIESSFWEQKFFDLMQDFRFMPAGRIISGAGSERRVTMFNCFVMGAIPDDITGIFDSLKEAALTMQQGGGIGYNFSTLRPKGAFVKGVGADASGPLSFMDVWDAMCRTIMSAGSRRGAMMAVMSCDHPDVEAFIEAKREAGRMRMFNLSVLVTDAFMLAVKEDGDWDLVFDGTVYKTIKARELWDTIMHSTYAFAEPGVIFIDRINRENNLNYCETISATNPCGEQPLPPYGACLLGSMNLARFVDRPFEDDAGIDLEELAESVSVAIRMMDNVVDASGFPLEQQQLEATSKRRIGLGITGLADALIMCGARYGGASAVRLTETWMAAIQRAAYLASVDLAKEKDAFPLFDAEKYLTGGHVRNLDEDVRAAIAEHGIRNALLTSVAPTGTISLFADNVSSGLEPVFSFKYTRNVLMPDGERKSEEVSDYAYRLFRRMHGSEAPLSSAFVDAQNLAPNDHLVMQAAVQKYIDSSISKTINVPEAINFEDFKDIYMQAYDLGCKGCTTYRPNDVTGAVLEVSGKESGSSVDSSEPELPLTQPIESVHPRDEGDSGAVVYMTQPLDRPGALDGATYKVNWPESDHAIYITINDILQDTRLRPFEVFINSKNMEHYAWTVALTRMISAVFRRGGDVSFVVEELKAVFDPRGGHWVGGKYVPSLLAAIGSVIEQHMIAIGFLTAPGKLANEADRELNVIGLDQNSGNRHSGNMADTASEEKTKSPFRYCPKCNQPAMMRQEGCDTCTSCAYSKCG